MSTTCKPRVPMSEQLKLINECRNSGLTDADWCRNHQIASSTFYNWISRCRKACADQIVEPKYGHSDLPRGKQDVVPVTVVSDNSHADYLPDPNRPLMAEQHLDNSHTIEVVWNQYKRSPAP